MKQFFLIILLVALTTLLNAQDCESNLRKVKQKNKALFENYSFTGLSDMFTLSSGDTARVRHVGGAGCDIRIFVQTDNPVENLQYRILKKQETTDIETGETEVFNNLTEDKLNYDEKLTKNQAYIIEVIFPFGAKLTCVYVFFGNKLPPEIPQNKSRNKKQKQDSEE